MKKNIYPGKFIVFDSLDGSGQSTEANLLKDFFIGNGCEVVLTKEPTLESKAGKKIRKILDKKEKISPQKLQGLFAQDRKEHLNNLVIPALKSGKIVISDRYFFSTFTYGVSDGLDLDWLIKINNDFLLPDLTIFLKVRPEVCIKRIEKRGIGKKLFEKKEKLKKVWKTYEILPNRIKNVYIMKGEGTIPEVFNRVKKLVNDKMRITCRPKLNRVIDQTNIKPGAKTRDIIKTCQEALKYDFRGVCVKPQWVKLVKQQLKDNDIKTICLVDAPIGDSSHGERLRVCQKAKKDGADETDVVMSLVDIKYERWGKIEKDLKEICRILPTKIIIGSGYLTDEEIIRASEIVQKSGAFCVKTATEKDPLENRELKEKARHLKLMRQGAPNILIKASGSIKTLKDAKEMIKAGADIIGTSSGVKIFKKDKHEL